MKTIEYKSIEWYEERLKEYQHLQALVLTFTKDFGNELSIDMTKKYNKHFGIERLREGRIEEPKKYSDLKDHFLSTERIKLHPPYPTREDLDKAELENPGYTAHCNGSCILLIEKSTNE